eukprot:2984389-Rhodomonas_salina.2
MFRTASFTLNPGPQPQTPFQPKPQTLHPKHSGPTKHGSPDWVSAAGRWRMPAAINSSSDTRRPARFDASDPLHAFPCMRQHLSVSDAEEVGLFVWCVCVGKVLVVVLRCRACQRVRVFVMHMPRLHTLQTLTTTTKNNTDRDLEEEEGAIARILSLSKRRCSPGPTFFQHRASRTKRFPSDHKQIQTHFQDRTFLARKAQHCALYDGSSIAYGMTKANRKGGVGKAEEGWGATCLTLDHLQCLKHSPSCQLRRAMGSGR